MLEGAMSFRSKIDIWHLLLIIFPPILCLSVSLYLQFKHSDAVWISLLALLLLIGVYKSLIFPLRYSLEKDALLIHFGFIKRWIPYKEIRSVSSNCNFHGNGSPTLSRDRIQIRMKDSRTLISPKDKATFIKELSHRIPHLSRSSEHHLRSLNSLLT